MSTTTTLLDAELKEICKPIVDVILKTIEEEERYNIRDVNDYIPTLTFKNTKNKHVSYFLALGKFFRLKGFEEVFKFIYHPQDPNKFPQESWNERINMLVCNVLFSTAPDYQHQFHETLTGQQNLYYLMIVTKYVVPEYIARNKFNQLTYSPRMNFLRFQLKVTEVTSLARRSGYPVNDRDVVMTIIGNMQKSPKTLVIGQTAYNLKKYESLFEFYDFLNMIREYGTSPLVLRAILLDLA